jgi:hypothetical protein
LKYSPHSGTLVASIVEETIKMLRETDFEKMGKIADGAREDALKTLANCVKAGGLEKQLFALGTYGQTGLDEMDIGALYNLFDALLILESDLLRLAEGQLKLVDERKEALNALVNGIEAAALEELGGAIDPRAEDYSGERLIKTINALCTLKDDLLRMATAELDKKAAQDEVL